MGNRAAGARGAFVLAALLVSLTSLFASHRALGETPVQGKSGLEVQSFGDGPTISRGMMLGFRSSRYIQRSQVSLGLEALAGSSHGGRLDQDNLTYGGITLGYDGTFATIFNYDLSMLVGYGYGRVDSLGIGGVSFTAQPTLALGLTLIEGYRASFAVGYLYMPSTSGFSHFTFGIRLEQKSDSYNQGVSY